VKALSETMVEFWDEGEHQQDHKAFKEWQRQRENKYGHVLNYPPGELVVFHKVGCAHIWDFSRPSASLAEHRKVCSPVKAELLSYAGKPREDWRLCETCGGKHHDHLV
jgi:hypothetical protein